MSTQASGPHKRHALLTICNAIRGLLVTAMLGACGGTPDVDLDFGDATETSEAGGSVEVSLTLERKPRGVIRIYAVSSDPSEGVVSEAIQFDERDWDQPRTLTITGVDDPDVDGDVSYQVSFYLLASWLPGLPRRITTLTLTNTDDDTDEELARFDALGDLPGGERASYVGDVSAAGDVVVGWSSSEGGDQAVRWTPQGGLVGLGGPESRAQAVSPNGRIIVGSVAEPSYLLGRAGVRWVDGQPHEILEGPRVAPNGPILFMVVDGLTVRDNGRIYGTCLQFGAYGEPLACFFAGPGSVETFLFGKVFAADDAGNLAGTRQAERHAPFQSSATYNGTALPYADGVTCSPSMGGCLAEARDFSSGGALVVGTSHVPTPSSGFSALFDIAFTFSQDQGSSSLPDLAGGALASGAYAVSADGRVIAGFGSDANGQQAVLWLERTPLLLADLVHEAGGQVPGGFRLLEVRAMSADARTFVGNGTNAEGAPEAFRIVLPSAP
jgi:hypothetical protein